MELHLRSDAKDEARALILEHHYSGCWPAVVRFVVTWHADGGLFGDRGPAVAAAVFGLPATRWACDLLELQRLVAVPGQVCLPLTGLLSAAVAEIRFLKLSDLVVSYADPGQGHHGGIYQAGSWSYSGLFGSEGGHGYYRIGGKVVHSRTVSGMFGSRSAEVIARRARCPVQKLKPQAKHLYWRALNRRGKAKAKRLGLESLPYPKPAREASGG